MAVQIQLRNGTAAQWTAANPVLAAGEVGIESDTRRQKFGDGTTAWNSLSYAGGSGTVTGVTGTSPVASSGGAAPAISLASGYGDTQNPYASKTANQVLAAPNGTSGVPSFRALVSADIPTLNQNTTGTAAGLSSTLAVTSGGTGLTSGTSGGVPYFSGASAISSSAALTANALIVGGGAGAAPAPLASLGTATTVLHGNASGAPTFGAVSLSADVSGTLPVANGGTGQTSYTDGQLLIGNSTGNTLTKATLTAGTNVTITNSAGGITIAASGGGGGSPGGSNTQVQYNNSGAFGGISGFTTDGTRVTASTTIGVGGATPSTSGAGITFPATQSASTNANTLDDYEEGTWTPTLGGTATYGTIIGNYTKVGKLVHVSYQMQVTTIGTGSTTNVDGLPFIGIGGSPCLGATWWENISAARTYVASQYTGGSTDFYFVGTNASTVSASNVIAVFGNSTLIRGSFTYITT